MERRLTYLTLLLAPVSVLSAQVADDTPKELASQRRMALMQEALADCRVEAKSSLSPAEVQLGTTPLLRYDDPTRSIEERRTDGLLDATVWRMGEQGRPTALITLELYRAGEKRAVISYEFLSLSPQSFELTSPRGPKWKPTATPLTMSSLKGAPVAAASARTRLTQMRQLARRFSVLEEIKDGNKIECRLLSQPIDRYSGGEQKVVDGAIFAFANGTNPEVGLLLECDGKGWQYGLVRLSSAALFARLDDKPIWEAPKVMKSGGLDPYVGMAYGIDWNE